MIQDLAIHALAPLMAVENLIGQIQDVGCVRIACCQQYLELGFNGFLDKPMRAEQVYECLFEHLGVTFEFQELMAGPGGPRADWRGVTLPPKIYADLISAAEQHSITELRRHISVLEGLGEEEQQLAAYLSELSRQFDISGIEAVLGEINLE